MAPCKNRSVSFLLRLAAAVAALLLTPPAVTGSLYRCTEANGKITYSSSPCTESGNSGAEKTLAFPAAPPRVAAAPKLSAAVLPERLTPARPRAVAIRIFYDPANAPKEHPVNKMAWLIRAALASWSAGCAVQLEYHGTAPYFSPGSPDGVSIRWSAELMRARHPANPAAGIAGTGSMEAGISLRQRVADESLQHIILHEIGHVLGMGHSHDAGDSVMSYLPDEAQVNSVQPSTADYLACNRALKARYGLDIALPVEEQRNKMDDREALERIYGRRK